MLHQPLGGEDLEEEEEFNGIIQGEEEEEEEENSTTTPVREFPHDEQEGIPDETQKVSKVKAVTQK